MNYQSTALILILSLIIPMNLPDDEVVSVKSWSFNFRLGGFSTSNDWIPRGSLMPHGTAGIELSHFIGERQSISMTVDGSVFAGDHIAMMPITVSYKFFPTGNASVIRKGASHSPIVPWFGGGAGIYLNGPHRRSLGDIAFGTHASAGATILFGSSFEINTELRYSITSDIRVFNYLMGIGFRF